MSLARHLYPNHRFMIFDERQIPVKNNSIDYIIIVAVLHHISDDQIKQYLLEFNRIFKPGGKIIVMEPYLCERTKFNVSVKLFPPSTTTLAMRS
ncbi:class I SAM-dependent methyltransferase [Paenibacillus sp. NPDC056579]|uniref:class I SAM-dependent methyltransferase n=1 Tax=Paenibacillus sp. NPDC056579 TaxID=3345871 RepID=UPI0036C94B54